MWQNDDRRIRSSAENTAIFNLIHMVRSHSEGRRYGPDIVIKAFKDLDTVFFGGRLRGNVYIMWADEYMIGSLQMAHAVWGVCQRPRRGERGQVRIVLNADTIFRKELSDIVVSPLERMFGVLLHEVRFPTTCISFSFKDRADLKDYY